MQAAPRIASAPASHHSGAAHVGLAYDDDDGVTRVAALFQRSPLRALFPYAPAAESAVAHVTLVNTSGGIVAGDRLETNVALDADACAVVTSQAAEKVYRSTGATAQVANRLSLAPGAWLEWLPHETILFDGARLRRSLHVDVAAGARALVGEVLVLGRIAHGEHVTRAFVHDAWRVRFGERLVWADALKLDGDVAQLVAAAHGLGGARACATLCYVGADAPRALEPLRAAFSDDVACGATSLGAVTIARFVAHDPRALRAVVAAAWSAVRATTASLPATTPPGWK